MDVKFDHNALRKVITDLKLPTGPAEWCVACGAGAASEKLNFPEEVVRQTSAQFVQPEVLRDLVSSIKAAAGEAAWCVGCGAGASALPADQVSNPAEISDQMIDTMARKLVSAVRVE